MSYPGVIITMKKAEAGYRVTSKGTVRKERNMAGKEHHRKQEQQRQSFR